MARVLDLDAARAARAEAQQDKPVITFGGKEFTLPAELPWEVAEAAASGDGVAALKSIELLLGDQWGEFKKLNPTLADVMLVVEAIGRFYGTDPGK